MKKKFADIIMNPVRQRIVQYFILHPKATVSEIAAELSDVSRASLYRHIKILFEAGCLEVLEEKPVRGTVERTYGLVSQPMGNDVSKQDVSMLIQNSLFAIMASFAQYFQNSSTEDAQKDMISVSSCTLLLSDKEFTDMLGKIGQVYNEYLNNKPTAERKERCLTFISAPPQKDGKGENHA